MVRLHPSLCTSLSPVHRSWIWMGESHLHGAMAETLAVTREEGMDDALQRARRVYAALDQG